MWQVKLLRKIGCWLEPPHVFAVGHVVARIASAGVP